MFANLIESASHQQDLARKGRFFLATLISYAVIVACAGMASIYAYDAHLEDNQELEFLGLVPPIVPDQPANTPRNSGPKVSPKNRQTSSLPERTVAIDHVSTKIPIGVSAIKSDVPEIPMGAYKLGNSNTNPEIGGPATGVISGGGGTGPVVKMDTTPPPIRVKPENTAQPTIIRKSSVLNGEAKLLPKPPYPPLARTAGVSGQVSVQVTIDESGKIVSARAASGHPMLTSAAVRAALQARFNPTLLNGVPVKVSGFITYNFSLQ